jgi:hypothetical protein
MRDAFDEYTAHPPSEFDHYSAPTAGFSGVFEQLVSEHRQAARLISRLFLAQGKQRTELWTVLRRNLLAHEYAEQHALYANLANYPSLQPLLDEHTSDIPHVEILILQLDALEVDTAAWELLLHRLEAALNGHVETEEVALFPRAQDLLGQQRSLELSLIYIDAKSSLSLSSAIGAAREGLKKSSPAAA